MVDKIFEKLNNWITGYTPGEYRDKSHFKYYQENLWNYIYGLREDLLQKDELTEFQKEFLDTVFYTGRIYRIQNYKKNKKYIEEMNYGQSWSYDIEGVSDVTNLHQDFLLIIGYVENGINLINLLKFFCEEGNEDKIIEKYERYIKEHEIVAPTLYRNIIDVKIANKENLKEWEQLDSVPSSKYM